MKRFFACFLFLIMMLTVFSGCERNSDGENTSDTSFVPETDTEQKNNLQEQLQNIRIDGSASTVTLEAGIRAALLGISQGEAEKQVSRTDDSFRNLIENKCDIIFTDSTPLQSDYASSKGFEVETFKIAMEGLVFIVNKDNPIEKLTQQQIKDIYSGKITNWKDVGGSDAEIIAYQHKPASVSQNYMTAFMGDTPLMKAKTVALPAELEGLEGAVASYDNGINSIGYCVYSYAAEMYAGANDVKFIKIDDIQPSKDTMADASYPLISYSYAVINKNTPEDSPIRALIDWILSTPGQKAVADSGYIPVSNLNTLEQTILNTRGTGPEKPADFKMPSTYYSAISYLKYDEKKGDKGTEYYNYRIEGLKNKSLQKEINSFIKQAETNANAQRSEVEDYAKSCFESAHLHSLYVESLCSNGYLYVVISNTYDEGTDISPNYYYRPVAAVWDLYTGKRLNFSDLFWKDEEFLPAVNTEVRKRLNIPYDILGDTYELKRDFWALPENFSTFTWNYIYFASREGVFTHGICVEFAAQYREMLVTSQLRDMKDIWEDTVSVNKEYYVYS